MAMVVLKNDMGRIFSASAYFPKNNAWLYFRGNLTILSGIVVITSQGHINFNKIQYFLNGDGCIEK